MFSNLIATSRFSLTIEIRHLIIVPKDPTENTMSSYGPGTYPEEPILETYPTFRKIIEILNFLLQIN